MDITHLHLHVRDRRKASEFYRHWFGLTVLREDDAITFLTGSDDFLLALMQDAAPGPMPPWFHFGVRLPSQDTLRDLHARMQREHVQLAKPLYEDSTFMSFRCVDPDGYAVEVYWEA
jgi:catechol-2,3-dioxygenase